MLRRPIPLILLITFTLLVPALSSALPTPGLNGERTEAVYGRIFPDALETNDFISYREAWAGLAVLDERHPDLMEVHVVGESFGLLNRITGNRDRFEVFIVEVTNEASAIPYEVKAKTAFIMSVHGNEKGGREGGLRAIEDLVSGKGIVSEVPGLAAMLDSQVVVFAFPNADGWVHDEAEYFTGQPCTSVPFACGGGFTRENGDGVDLNRQDATVGYLDQSPKAYRTYEQPEIHAISGFLRNLTNVVAGVDHHGMLEHDNFVAIMVKDGERTQQEIVENERLAEAVKTRMNANPYYAAFQDVPEIADAWGGGDFAEWMTTYDAIGYSASGTGGGFVVQDIGLNAPGFTVEMAYNHIAFDDKYPGAGQFMNAYHVRATRDMVISFMEFASEKTMVSYAASASGGRVAVLDTDYLATNAGDDLSSLSGWFTETDADDDLDILHNVFESSPREFWNDFEGYAATGLLDRYDSAADLVAGLGSVATVVIPGSAVAKLTDDEASTAALKAWTEAGGNLVLTDDALQLLEALGLVKAGAVKRIQSYSGHSDVADYTHPFIAGVRGGPRQTFDPNPLGFAPDTSPVWVVAAGSFDGDVVGSAAGDVNLGELKVGSGTVRIFGAILPDATTSTPHPYGLDGYSVTIFGNQVLMNLMNLERITEMKAFDGLTVEPAVAADSDGDDGGNSIPGAPALLALGLVGVAAKLTRRSRR